MMRPHLLTRVKGLEMCEYTRFKAEASAIFVREVIGFSAKLPRLSQSEYKTDEEIPLSEEPTAAPITTISDAVEAIRLEDYERALAFFEQLVVRRPEYHIAWLRLGHIRREQAVRIIGTDNEAAIRLLRSAVLDLQRATEHRDPEYQALARYELSKAYYHLARLLPDDAGLRSESYNEALAAFALSNEKKYQSWCEHIEQYAPWNRTTATSITAG
jgi:tetratricopeptide (TPR) repeat protein